MEIREIFVEHIQEWFKDAVEKDHSALGSFCEAFKLADTEQIEKQLNAYLWKSISVRDFYHGILIGLLQYNEDWFVKSNAESGLGYSDILIETPDGVGIVIELKYASDNNLALHCEEALRQIEDKDYDAYLIDDGMESIIKYGIAFYKKKCKVMVK
jgi:hypothetical protein